MSDEIEKKQKTVEAPNKSETKGVEKSVEDEVREERKEADAAVTELKEQTEKEITGFPERHNNDPLPEETIKEMEDMVPVAVGAKDKLDEGANEVLNNSGTYAGEVVPRKLVDASKTPLKEGNVDDKELDINNQEAQKLLAAINRERAAQVKLALGKEVDVSAVEGYLNEKVDLSEMNPDEIKFLYATLKKIEYLTLSENIYEPQNLKHREFIDMPFGDHNMQYEASRFRARAVIQQHKNRGLDVPEAMRQDFAWALANEFNTTSNPIPDQVRFMLTPEQRKDLDEDIKNNLTRKDENKKIALDIIHSMREKKRKQREEQGITPGIIDRIENVELQKGDTILSQGTQFNARVPKIYSSIVEKFPDPRLLMNRILELKDGKIPI